MLTDLKVVNRVLQPMGTLEHGIDQITIQGPTPEHSCVKDTVLIYEPLGDISYATINNHGSIYSFVT